MNVECANASELATDLDAQEELISKFRPWSETNLGVTSISPLDACPLWHRICKRSWPLPLQSYHRDEAHVYPVNGGLNHPLVSLDPSSPKQTSLIAIALTRASPVSLNYLGTSKTMATRRPTTTWLDRSSTVIGRNWRHILTGSLNRMS